MNKTKFFLLILSAFCTISICHAQGQHEIVLDTTHIKMSDVSKPSTPGMVFFDIQIPRKKLLPGQTMLIPFRLEDPVPNISGVWLGSTFGSGAPELIFTVALISEKSGFELYIHNPHSSPIFVDMDGVVVRFFIALSQS
jgi:hypothetical protein